jgi:zinc protease
VATRLGDGDRRRPPARTAIAPAPLDGVRVHLVDRPGAAQTELIVGHVGVPRAHPDFLALAVLNSILGGKFTSRINLNLRERHGYTYGATSRFDGRQEAGPFSVNAAVATPAAGAAAAEVVAELARIRDQPVSPAELADSRNYLVGVFPYTLQTVSGLARLLGRLVVYGLPDDYWERYPEAVQAVSRERVQEVAQRHLRPDALAIVAVGPAGDLAPQFERWAPVEVHPPAGQAPATGAPR